METKNRWLLNEYSGLDGYLTSTAQVRIASILQNTDILCAWLQNVPLLNIYKLLSVGHRNLIVYAPKIRLVLISLRLASLTNFMLKFSALKPVKCKLMLK